MGSDHLRDALLRGHGRYDRRCSTGGTLLDDICRRTISGYDRAELLPESKDGYVETLQDADRPHGNVEESVDESNTHQVLR